MKYYVTIKHPVTGDSIVALPTGQTRERQSTSGEIEAEARVLTPNSNLDTIWFSKEDIITPAEELTPF